MHAYKCMFYENTFYIILILGFFQIWTDQNQFQLRRVSMESVEQNIELLLTFTKIPFGNCTLSTYSLLWGMFLWLVYLMVALKIPQ